MSIKHEATVPTDAAIWAAIIMLILTVVIITFFCCVPVYRTMQRRWKHWDNPENDPRWERDTFQFSPTSPRMDRLELPSRGSGLPKYNRLSTASSLSMSSSVRGHQMDRQPDAACQMPRDPDQIEIQLPAKYAEIFKLAGDEESLGTPKLRYSQSPAEDEIKTETEIVQENVTKQQNKNRIKKGVKQPKFTSYKKIDTENDDSPINENADTKLDEKIKHETQLESTTETSEDIEKKENSNNTNTSAKYTKLTNEEEKNEPKNKNPKSYKKMKKSELKPAVKLDSNNASEINNEKE